MNINVKSCFQCPFLVSIYDDYALGFDTIDYCNLARFLKLEEDTIDVYNSYEQDIECDYCRDLENYDDYNNELCKCKELNIQTEESKRKPDWCPLNKEYVVIE